MDCAFEFVDPIVEIEEQEARFWPFILALFMYDDGYIRYDYDKENENGKLHPLRHYDIFHASKSTFKIGLDHNINPEEFVDLVNIKTCCHFVRP